jgi:hypothetical protein
VWLKGLGKLKQNPHKHGKVAGKMRNLAVNTEYVTQKNGEGTRFPLVPDFSDTKYYKNYFTCRCTHELCAVCRMILTKL